MAEAGTQVLATVTQVGSAELLTNTGFESSTTGWESNTAFGAYVAATLARSSSQHKAGSWSLRATWGDGAGTTRSVVNTSRSDLVVGNAYTFKGWAYVPSGSQDVQPVVFFQKAGRPITEKDQWVAFELSFVATSTQHFVGVETVSYAAAGGLCYVDEASLKQPFAIVVDGATTPCPAAAAQATPEAAPVFYVNDRVTVTVRNPTVPLIEGVESTDPPSSDPAAGYVSPLCGDIKMTGRGSPADANWLECDGSQVSRTTYAALFSVIGVTFGAGNGSTTFNLPDFTDKFPAGYTLGNTGGAPTANVGDHSHTGPSHTHSVSVSSHSHTESTHSHSGPSHTHTTGSHSHGIPTGGGHTHSSPVGNPVTVNGTGNQNVTGWGEYNSHTHGAISGHDHSGSTGNGGSGPTGSAGGGSTGSAGGGSTGSSAPSASSGAAGTGSTGTAGSHQVATVPPYLGVTFLIRCF